MVLLLFTMLFILNFLSVFTGSKLVSYVVGVIAVLCWIVSLTGANKLYKTVGLIFTFLGLAIIIYQQIPLVNIPLYMTDNVTLLSIFFVLPFINSIVVVGRYEKNASRILRFKSNNLGQIYVRSSLVSFVLGGMLNIATIPLVVSVVQKNFVAFKDTMLTKIIIAKSMLRGFVLSLAWSPMEIVIAISLGITGLDYLALLPWLLFLSLILLVINLIVGQKFKSHVIHNDGVKGEELQRKQLRKIMALGLYLCFFILITVALTKLVDISFLAAVSFVIVPFSFVWALLINRIKSFVSYSIPIWKLKATSLKGYMILFLSVGLFTGTLGETSIISHLQKPFFTLVDTPVFLFVFIQFIFIVFAMLGFHSIVTLTILGEIIKPLVHLLNPLSLSIVLIFSGMSPTMFSPFNISATLTGDLLGINPFKITWWNLGFAFFFSSMGTILALFILYLF